jgi:hypothetical protein
MNKRYLVLLALLAWLTGCVPVDSLNPLYTDKDIVFDESLVGTWVGPDNGQEGALEFSKLDQNGKQAYVMTMTDKSGDDGRCKSVTVYHAHLVNLNGRRFLDVVPETIDARAESYPLQIKPGKNGTTIEPRMLRLSSAAYLEFGDKSQANGKVQAKLRRAHWFLKVNQDNKKLQLNWADDDVFRKAVEAGTVKLPNMLLGNGKNKDVVITASTQELQKFVAEHAEDATFFNSKTEEMHRKD